VEHGGVVLPAGQEEEQQRQRAENHLHKTTQK
jgi:hypothetical protein